MRCSTIAVLMLILLPSSASACWDEHKENWLKEAPARSWLARDEGAAGSLWERMLGLGILAGGSASLGLVAVSIRSVSRREGRGRAEKETSST